MTRLTPLPEQIQGAQFLASHEGGCLFDEPGAGKTLTLILAADMVQAQHVLVLCPSVVKRNWERNLLQQSAFQRRVEIVDGFAKRPYPAGVVIASHAAVANAASHLNLLRSGPWDAIIVDESDGMANTKARRTQALYGQGPYGLWRYSRYTWSATGTPYVNSAADLYPIMSSVLARRLGAVPSYYDFCKRYTTIKPDGFGGWKPVGIQNEAELKAALAPHMLARKCPVALPQLRLGTYPVDIEPIALRAIVYSLQGMSEAQVIHAIEQEDGEDEAISRVRHALGLAKVAPAAEYLDSLMRQGAGPLIAFTLHTDVMDQLRDALRGNWRVSCIDGRNSGNAQTEADTFQQGRTDILLIQIKAGGVGITLTRSNRCVVVEQPWTAKDLEQAVKRLHRISQVRPVLAEILYAADCWLDELAARLIAEKGRAAAYLTNR